MLCLQLRRFSLIILISLFDCDKFKIVVGFSMSDCTLFDSHMGATFGLSELKRSSDQPPYVIEDGDIPCTTKVEPNYTYTFNICGTIATSIPPVCSNNPSISSSLSTVSALQVSKGKLDYTPSDDSCYLVGKFIEEKTTLTLIDHNDPTQGLKLSYKGAQCSNRKERVFNILLTCADKLNPTPLHAIELALCEYMVTVPSVYGCPLECPISKRSLCGGAGYCAYDYDAQTARCFCNQGYSGSDCSQSASSSSSNSASEINYSPALLGLIITLFVIVGILVASVFLMVRQIHAYKEDISHYQELKGGDEENKGQSISL